MALAELLRDLEHTADAEARAISDAGAAEVARIEAAAARTRADRRAAAAGALAAELGGLTDTELAGARRAARVAVLEARAAMLDRVREAVRASLPAMLEEHAARVGPGLVRDALACTGGGSGVLHCAPALDAGARAAAPAALRIELDPQSTGIAI
jgi:vacuolar-type H+-ATPase subunit E/Vma4